VKEYPYKMRNPSTGTVTRPDRMDDAKAAVSNYYLKQNGKRVRWSRRRNGTWFTPMHQPETNPDKLPTSSLHFSIVRI
jgi:hypothetical protein